MRKLVIVTLAVLITGLVSSCSKEAVKPSAVKTITVVADKSDVGNGDG